MVASGLPCTDAAISLWETGRRLPSSTMLSRIIHVFIQLGATDDEITHLTSDWIRQRAQRRSPNGELEFWRPKLVDESPTATP
jgi:hypothetical protein